MRRLCIVYLPLRIRVVVGVKVKMGLCGGCSLAITFGVGSTYFESFAFTGTVHVYFEKQSITTSIHIFKLFIYLVLPDPNRRDQSGLRRHLRTAPSSDDQSGVRTGSITKDQSSFVLSVGPPLSQSANQGANQGSLVLTPRCI
jgi:hypothetical protein